jgi:hypothetical protein
MKNVQPQRPRALLLFDVPRETIFGKFLSFMIKIVGFDEKGYFLIIRKNS